MMFTWNRPEKHRSPRRKAHQILSLFLSGLLLFSLCACSTDAGDQAANKPQEQQEEAVTLDSVFSLMANGSAEMCVEQLKSLENDPETAEWLTFVTAVQEDRFDDAKALFLRLTESWTPEKKSLMVEGNLYGLSRFISRWCKECDVESFRYLCLVEHAGIAGTDITELYRDEIRSKKDLSDVARYSASAWRVSREDYQKLLARCGTDPDGAVLIVVDPGDKDVIVWTAMMGLMPGKFFSDNPAKIGYILKIEQTNSFQGTYNNGTKAYSRACTVSLTSIPSGIVLFKKTYDPHKAPETTTATKQDTYGNSFTMSEVQADFLEAVSRLLDCTADEYRFLPKADGTAVCIQYFGEENSLVIPGSVQDRPVTEIGDSFASRSNIADTLVSVELPDTVRQIGSNAFGECKNLEKINMPAELETINDEAFLETSSLASAVLPDSCTDIRYRAFTASGISELHIPSGLDHISSYCFAGCTNLTALEIPGTVRSVQSHAFRGCTGLISVTIDEGCEEIGTSAFEGCENLRELTLPESIEIEVDAFRGCDLLNR